MACIGVTPERAEELKAEPGAVPSLIEDVNRLSRMLCAATKRMAPVDIEAVPDLSEWVQIHEVLDAARAN